MQDIHSNVASIINLYIDNQETSKKAVLRASPLPLTNAVRAVELENGDVFSIKDLTVEFEDGLFYEVVFNGYDKYMQKLWNRTGRVLDMHELNDYCK